jgi:translation elongation factor EF-1beta/outer membrane murein-binding lipoprotein Lpp
MQFQTLLEEVKRGNAAVEKKKLEEIEQNYSYWKATGKSGGSSAGQSSLVSEIAAARKRIGDVLKEVTTPQVESGASSGKDGDRITKLEKENSTIRQELNDLRRLVEAMRSKIDELSGGKSVAPAAKQAAPAQNNQAKAPAKADEEDVDLFGSDEEEDDEKARVREERLKAYADKKKAKPGPIAKSSVILDVKPWDDETNMQELEKAVRTVQMEGLVWGASKLVPVGYGIKKLQIMCVVEDEKVSVDELAEKIQEFEDFIQSVDIAAFNKI